MAIELYINGKLVDLAPDFSLTIQNELFSPVTTVSKTGTFSYSFNIPASPTNNRILNYPNVLEHGSIGNRYQAELYADSVKLFDGSLVIASYADNQYSANLVNLKINSIDDLFGDASLNEMRWMVDFDGIATINQVNNDISSKYYFPLVSQGVFQKEPYLTDDVSSDYTSKYLIDKYNQWFYSSFPPVLSALETMKHCFTTKGYRVGGNAFEDTVLSNIYLSTHLAADQGTKYNLGNPKLGKVVITGSFNTNNSGFTRGTQSLNFPYFQVGGKPSTTSRTSSYIAYNTDIQYNWDKVDYFSLLKSGLTQTDSYLYKNGDNIVVIPETGWYKITLSANTSLVDPTTNISYITKVNYQAGAGVQEEAESADKNATETCPLELQLIRNHSDESCKIELIKGNENRYYITGKRQATYQIPNRIGEPARYASNIVDWVTEFPHEAIGYGQKYPTDPQMITPTTTASGRPRTAVVTNTSADPDWYSMGYVHQGTMAFDQGVTKNFILGLSSLSNGTPAVMKDGRSWSRMYTSQNHCIANVNGYAETLVSNDGTVTKVNLTNKNKNIWKDAPTNTCVVSNQSAMSGTVAALVYLEKNDVLELMAVQRCYTAAQQLYGWSGNYQLSIEAFSDRSEDALRSDNVSYTASTELETQLNLANFMSNDIKVKDWIKDIATALNLSVEINGNDVTINKNISNTSNDVVQLKNGTLQNVERIDFPRSMSVQWNIDKDEYGFELSVPQDAIDFDDWYNYGDSGYTKIEFSDDIYNTTDANTTTKFSYNWYCPFTLQLLDASGNTLSQKEIRLPMINLAERQADSVSYEEDMKSDGLSLAQRFYFRQPTSSDYVWTTRKEKVFLSYPTNIFEGVELSYKTGNKTLLTRFFDIKPLLGSQYATISTLITTDEYLRILNGALVHWDSDLYYVCSVQFDVVNNAAEIRAVRKVN